MIIKFGTKMHRGTRRKETTPVLSSGFTCVTLHHGLKPVSIILYYPIILTCLLTYCSTCTGKAQVVFILDCAFSVKGCVSCF